VSRVGWPIVRALVVARWREIAWSPARQLFMVAAAAFAALTGVLATGLTPSSSTWFRILFLALAFRFGTELYTAASPAGLDIFDFNKRLGPGHTMAQLPAGALERLAATSLLALPLSIPYVVAVLLSGLLLGNNAKSTALHWAFVVAGFATRGASKQFARGSLQKWSMRLPQSLPVYGSLRGGEVGAAFWAVAAQSVYGPVVGFGAMLFAVWITPGLASGLGVVHGSLAIVGVVAVGVAISVVSLGSLLGPLSRVAISRRAFALAALQVVLVLAVLSGVPAIGLAAAHYGSAAGARGGVHLFATLLGFESLAAVAIARFATAANQIATTLLVAAPLTAALIATSFIAVLFPFVMPALGAIAAVVFALALLLAFTAPRVPLSRAPIGVVGAALRLIGAA